MSDHIIVSIFLRGAMDGLSYLVPHDDIDYRAARPDLAIPSSAVMQLDDTFGLHPAAAPLWDIWQDGEVAFVPASGSIDDSRSHFDASGIMETGLGPDEIGGSGWLGRYVDASSTGEQLEAVAVGKIVPLTLLGFPATIGLASLSSFRLGPLRGQGISRNVDDAIRNLYQSPGEDLVTSQGVSSFGVLDTLEAAGLTGMETPVEFGDSSIGSDLWQASQLIDADLGVRAITADFGGWDHHDGLGVFDEGRMHDQLLALTTAIAGFWGSIADHRDRVTLVVMTEFGRRVQQNANGGTDHGHGGVMTILGGGINGGVHGDWAGLGSDVLDRGDVPVLTDYRTVLSELIDIRADEGGLADAVFPDFPTGKANYVGVA